MFLSIPCNLHPAETGTDDALLPLLSLQQSLGMLAVKAKVISPTKKPTKNLTIPDKLKAVFDKIWAYAENKHLRLDNPADWVKAIDQYKTTVSDPGLAILVVIGAEKNALKNYTDLYFESKKPPKSKKSSKRTLPDLTTQKYKCFFTEYLREVKPDITDLEIATQYTQLITNPSSEPLRQMTFSQWYQLLTDKEVEAINAKCLKKE